MERTVLSIAEASELVGVSRRTIHTWLATGKIGYSRTAGGSIRIFSDTLWHEARRSAWSAAPGHPASSSQGWLPRT